MNVVDFFKRGMTISSKEDVGAKQWHFTPDSVVFPLINQIDNISEKTFAVLYNIEITSYLVEKGANPDNITFFSDCDVRTRASQSLELETVNIGDNFEGFNNMKKFDVIITNPPYTKMSGNNKGNNIYQDIINKIYTKCNELIVICPESFLSGKSFLKIRKEICSFFNNINNIKFLTSNDWLGQNIAIRTIGFHCNKDNKEQTTIISDQGNYSISFKDFDYTLINLGDNSNFVQKVLEHQSLNKFKLYEGTRKTEKIDIPNTYGIKKISCKNKCETIHGFGSYELFNDGYFSQKVMENPKVVFGLAQTNAVIPVDKNIGIPNKYVYINCASFNEANKLADYFMTKFIQLVAFKNRTSKGLNSPQLAFVPVIDMNQFDEINDEVIYNYFGIDEEMKKYIENELENIKKERNTINPY